MYTFHRHSCKMTDARVSMLWCRETQEPLHLWLSGADEQMTAECYRTDAAKQRELARIELLADADDAPAAAVAQAEARAPCPSRLPRAKRAERRNAPPR